MNVFTAEDLYKFNDLIYKLEDAGFEDQANDLRTIRDTHFNEDGYPVSEAVN